MKQITVSDEVHKKLSFKKIELSVTSFDALIIRFLDKYEDEKEDEDKIQNNS